MKWNIEKSMKLKKKIAAKPELMSQLMEHTEACFKEFKVKLAGMSYVFEPRVFSMDPKEAPEVMNRSRSAMLTAIMESMVVEQAGTSMATAIDMSGYTIPFPQCGPMDPFSLKILEKIRIRKQLSDDPIPIRTSDQLMRRIVGNRKLMRALSEGIFEILQGNGIRFNRREGCVFTPVIFQAPIYAQKVGQAAKFAEIRGFGPQLYASADPTPEPAAAAMKPFPGIIEMQQGRTLFPGVIIDRWWWIGIPAPELLEALQIMRKYY
jgi:hypothetical protein